MALNEYKSEKLYYSIKEVAEMFGVNESTLRYWEQEFPQLKPKTMGSSKVRQYSPQNIEQVKLIYNLVKVRGFKLAAAKKMLAQNRNGVEKTAQVLERLIAMRDELQAFKKSLNMLE